MSFTITKRIAYMLFGQTVLLLLLYAGFSLLSAVKFLADDPFAQSLPYHQVNAISNILLNLVILTGLLGGGIYAVASERADGEFTNLHLLTYAFYAWTGYLFIAVLAGLLGITEGRPMLEQSFWLDVLQLMILSVFVVAIVISVERWSAIPTVWLVGIILYVFSAILGVFETSNFLRDSTFSALSVGLTYNVAFVLSAVALGFWLMHRFSNITPTWAESGLFNVAGMLAIAGSIITIAPLYALGADDFAKTLGAVGIIVTPLFYIIFAAHSYHALRDRNLTQTLSAHWVALAVILFTIGIGIIGAISTVAGVNQWIQGTRLTDLQRTLTALAVVAMILGVINHAVAELRGENRRITGLLPFWLVAFGVIGSSVALGGAGLIQTYLERILSMGYLDTQTYMIPLYLAWIICLLAVALGVAIYALGFWVRRVRE